MIWVFLLIIWIVSCMRFPMYSVPWTVLLRGDSALQIRLIDWFIDRRCALTGTKSEVVLCRSCTWEISAAHWISYNSSKIGNWSNSFMSAAKSQEAALFFRSFLSGFSRWSPLWRFVQISWLWNWFTLNRKSIIRRYSMGCFLLTAPSTSSAVNRMLFSVHSSLSQVSWSKHFKVGGNHPRRTLWMKHLYLKGVTREAKILSSRNVHTSLLN